MLQARNSDTKEVVAIKKMSYHGRQSSDVSVVFS